MRPHAFHSRGVMMTDMETAADIVGVGVAFQAERADMAWVT